MFQEWREAAIWEYFTAVPFYLILFTGNPSFSSHCTLSPSPSPSPSPPPPPSYHQDHKYNHCHDCISLRWKKGKELKLATSWTPPTTTTLTHTYLVESARHVICAMCSLSIQGSSQPTWDGGEAEGEGGDPLEVAVTDTQHTQAVATRRTQIWKNRRNTVDRIREIQFTKSDKYRWIRWNTLYGFKARTQKGKNRQESKLVICNACS